MKTRVKRGAHTRDRKAQAPPSAADIAKAKDILGQSGQITQVIRPFLVASPIDSNQRKRPPNLDCDPALLDPDYRHRQLISDGRTLGREGLLKGAAAYKADFSVGWSWIPRYKGNNPEFRRIANDLMERWTERSNVQSSPHNWQGDLWRASYRINFDGDIAVAIVRDADNWPRMQLIEGHRIAQVGSVSSESTMPFPTVQTGAYKGYRIHNGVIMDDSMRPVAYRVVKPGRRIISYGLGENDYDDVSASSMKLVYNPEYASIARGIPTVCHGIEDWYDMFETTNAEKIAAKVNSKLSIIRKNETGAAPMANALNGFTGMSLPGVEYMADGLIQYIEHADQLTAHESNRPSGGWQWLIDHLIRRGMMGIGIPMEACYDMSKLGSASVRGVFQQVGRAIEREQKMLYPFALWVIRFAVGTFISTGRLPFVRDWWNWDFTLPAHPSIDAGRDANADREDYVHGLTALDFIAGKQGRSTEETMMSRAKDYQTAERIARENNVPFDYILPPSARGIMTQYEQVPKENGVDNLQA